MGFIVILLYAYQEIALSTKFTCFQLILLFWFFIVSSSFLWYFLIPDSIMLAYDTVIPCMGGSVAPCVSMTVMSALVGWSAVSSISRQVSIGGAVVPFFWI